MQIKKGQSIVIHPDVPHCYIQGTLVECMINSDNVVRGGLTPKYQDTKTLTEMLPYVMEKQEPHGGINHINDEHVMFTEYKTGYKEFRVFRLLMKGASSTLALPSFSTFSTMVVIEGEGIFESDEYGVQELDSLSAYFMLPRMKAKVQNATEKDLLIFLATCDV
eukprot:CAMPEP_0170556902 /NCGR_PEP_ID=MMETSP0211-20121228/19042_1 /TAXON_ID=311385 /ORGANISM="Pseudokeronopsis sp., Strain OXSARD2" /LENGTH=163 /DNA_ID=CAMNT_0010867507 /DNA_START=767 /DNA_END=1258 /DNA_ORIENTATION=-